MRKLSRCEIFTMFLIFCVLCAIPVIANNAPFFNYTFLDVVTGVVITLGLYYFARVNEEKNSKATKIDQVIDVFRKRLISLFDKPIDVENNKEEYLHSFKYLYNKFKLLEHMTKTFDCENEIAKIKENLDKIETYISDNLSEKNTYFSNKSRKEKIPNLIDTIEVQLDNITIKLFSFQE